MLHRRAGVCLSILWSYNICLCRPGLDGYWECILLCLIDNWIRTGCILNVLVFYLVSRDIYSPLAEPGAERRNPDYFPRSCYSSIVSQLPMFVSRPPIPDRLWLRERSLQTQLSLLAVRRNQTRNRPFHSTPRISFAARRSRPAPAPATRRAQRGGNDSLPVSKDGLMVNSHLNASGAEIAGDKLTRLGPAYWHYAKQDGVLPRMLPQHVFARVGVELISRAYSEAPSEISVRSISTGLSRDPWTE